MYHGWFHAMFSYYLLRRLQGRVYPSGAPDGMTLEVQKKKVEDLKDASFDSSPELHQEQATGAAAPPPAAAPARGDSLA
jgi:hypothetical protein